jgi:Ca-activated chloride channel family protein
MVITDGFINAERDVFELIQNNLNTTNFFSFGIGSSVNRYLIEGMAKAGLGEPFVVLGPGEASSVAERFRDYVQSPVLTQVKVKYKGFEAYDVEPRTLPDLFAQRPLVFFGKWRGEPGGQIEVSGKTGKGGYVQTFQVSETKPLEVNSALRYLWARSRIARLSDFNFGKDNPEVKEEVTSLGLTYSLVTSYTSFIAVLEVIRNQEGDGKDVDQPLPLPLNVSDPAVGDYAAGPEPEMVLLLTIVLLISSLLFFQRRRLAKAREGLLRLYPPLSNPGSPRRRRER